jgi:large subunit ribosomal protein L25
VELIEVNVELRTELGSTENNRLRKSGFVPGVLYSAGDDAKPIKIKRHHYETVISGKPSAQLFNLRSDAENINGVMALVKEAQIEPLKGLVQHFDFYAVKEGQMIRVSVPVNLVGECMAVKLGDAILNHLVYEVEVECIPTEIPEAFELDISDLKVGHSLHVRDIAIAKNVVIKEDSDAPIVSAVHKREEALQAETVEAVEGAEVATEAGEQTQAKESSGDAAKGE